MSKLEQVAVEALREEAVARLAVATTLGSWGGDAKRRAREFFDAFDAYHRASRADMIDAILTEDRKSE